MKRTAPIFLVAALILGTTFAGIAPASTSKTTSYFNDCGLGPVTMPSSVMQYCADGGAGVVNIKWSSWGTTSAKGTGTYYINGCSPSCVAGTIYKSSVNVLLNKLTKTHGKNYLMNVTVTPKAGKHFVWPPEMKPVPKKVTWTSDMWQG